MTRAAEPAEHWSGLCRKPPVFRTLQAGMVTLPESVHEGSPYGGAGGRGTFRRGVGAALSGIETLIHNPQLLWFSLLAGLVLAGNIVGQAALGYLDRFVHPGGIMALAQNGYVLDFFLEFITVFCLVFLLAGLMLSIPSTREDSASFSGGLAGAKKYGRTILRWSFVLALAGMLVFRIWCIIFTRLPHEVRFLDPFGPFFLTTTITQFPFNWTLDWNMLTEIPGYGGRSLLLLIYPFGFMEAMNFLAINLFLFLLTLFVVPCTVLGQQTLREAVVGSFTLMKRVWREVAACTAFLGIIVSAVFLSYLLVQAASGIVSPFRTVTFHPPDAWIALALLYNLGLVIVAFIVATVAGIAALELYRSAKTGQLPLSPEP